MKERDSFVFTLMHCDMKGLNRVIISYNIGLKIKKKNCVYSTNVSFDSVQTTVGNIDGIRSIDHREKV